MEEINSTLRHFKVKIPICIQTDGDFLLRYTLPLRKVINWFYPPNERRHATSHAQGEVVGKRTTRRRRSTAHYPITSATGRITEIIQP